MNALNSFAARKLFVLVSLTLALSLSSFASITACPPRPIAGSTVEDPLLLVSKNGALTINLTAINSLGPDGVMQYCFIYPDGKVEAPTLMVNPGDVLTINLLNRNTVTNMPNMPDMTPELHVTPAGGGYNPCVGGAMTSASTNIHFHGLNIPPVCHQDEVIHTSIDPGSKPFQYKIRIPDNEPAGLYWYHPHPHGFTGTQVLGGASGALIVGGLENYNPDVAGLPERVFVFRQKALPGGSDEGSVLSINFVPFKENLFARVLMKANERQLWRLLNSTSTQFLQLQLLNQGTPTNFQIVGLDGVPLDVARTTNTVVIPPAGRAEIVVQGPPRNGLYQLFNVGYDTGPAGDPNPAVLLANVVPTANGAATATLVPAPTKHETLRRFANLSQATVTRTRNLYFSEIADGSAFFITVQGHVPKAYDPNDPPAITTRQGDVEDWTITNHTTEVHAFHLHQLHFTVLEINGVPTNDTAVRDTVTVPYFNGEGDYPSVKIRVDFRDPETVGTFLYHCHILDHEDLGMMAKIRVLPAN